MWRELSGTSRLICPHMVFPGRQSWDSQNFTSLQQTSQEKRVEGMTWHWKSENIASAVLLVESQSLPRVRERREDIDPSSQQVEIRESADKICGNTVWHRADTQ